jgi:hypothetical protein
VGRVQELLVAQPTQRAALGVGADLPLAEGDLTWGGPSPTMGSLTSPHVRLDRSAPVNAKRLRFLACRHAAGHPPRPCSHDDTAAPCDAALLATEVARIRAWMDFASDLLDAHIWGFSAGDWKRDLDDPACIIVDPSVWPTPWIARSNKVRQGPDVTAPQNATWLFAGLRPIHVR